MLSANAWAIEQWGTVELGDLRLNRRAVQMGARIAANPESSLPNQMGSRAALRAAYRLLNHSEVTMGKLLAPHLEATRRAAGGQAIVLMVEDTTELDFTAHQQIQGVGPIGDGRGQGMLLHSTLAVIPDTREVLGLVHAQVVLRESSPKPRPKYTRSAEGQVWEVSAHSVGRPPAGVTWVHVADGGGDVFLYMTACLQEDKHLIVQACRNRCLQWAQGSVEACQGNSAHLRDYARSLKPVPDSEFGLWLPATKNKPGREAQMVMAWSAITVPSSSQAPAEIRELPPLALNLIHVWEPDPPEEGEAVEWILITSLPVNTLVDAEQVVDWYRCRWICEDYHQCMKTGCRVERSQLDHGADIQRLLGFAAPIAIRLLQLRGAARNTPDLPASRIVEPLMVTVLARRQQKNPMMTTHEFWRLVAQLGGHQGRRRDGDPGWRTVWRGWRLLSDWTDGARLFAPNDT